jgi:hypothetical protein
VVSFVIGVGATDQGRCVPKLLKLEHETGGLGPGLGRGSTQEDEKIVFSHLLGVTFLKPSI